MTDVQSVPHLLARASGGDCEGPNHCYYCGAPCGDENPSGTYVKDSFTGRGGVMSPASPWVCAGCVLCLREDTGIVQIDREHREHQRMRGYSWVITESSAVAATKAHIDRLRLLCLDPLEPPFAIVITDSGQTHQLYRGVVCRSRELVTVTLEGEPVMFRPEQLARALITAGKIAAATGKPALKEPISYATAMRVLAYHATDGESLLDDWQAIGESPLGRLAAWLCPNKETCALEYPATAADTLGSTRHGGVPPETGGTGGPERKGRGAGTGDRQGDRQPLLFDPRPSVL